MFNQLEFEIVEPINRDKGPKWICHTGRPDHGWMKKMFISRFGFEPDDIFDEGFYTFTGPVPEPEIDWGHDEDDG
jgi:hypothetical protein